MNEYFDVLNENGKPTGQKKLRSEVHRDGDWHRAIYIWIVNSKGEMLLQKRSALKDSHPNCWDTAVAGHVLAGNDSLPTAIREAEEELGLKIEEDELEYLFSYKHATRHNNGKFLNSSFYDNYLLQKDLDADKLELQEEEVAEVRWFKLEEIEAAFNRKDQNFVLHVLAYPRIFKLLHERFK